MSTLGLRIPLEQRFWSKVEKTESCWLWKASGRRGYGQIWVEGRLRKATHISLLLAGRPLKQGQMACHHCDTPACVRPDHLFAGTMGDNMRDCARKGRSGPIVRRERLRRGEQHPQAKLTRRQVVAIRALRASQRELARRFNVSKSTIAAVRSGRKWKEAIAA